jgi:SMC interacting uncharacterized protein involved in chromosome segregation
MKFKRLLPVQNELSNLSKALDLHYRTVNETEDLLEMRQTVDALHDTFIHLEGKLEELSGEVEKAEEVIEELKANIEAVEETIESMKPANLLDAEKVVILKKLEQVDLPTLQHLERILGLEYCPPY